MQKYLGTCVQQFFKSMYRKFIVIHLLNLKLNRPNKQDHNYTLYNALTLHRKT